MKTLYSTCVGVTPNLKDKLKQYKDLSDSQIEQLKQYIVKSLVSNKHS